MPVLHRTNFAAMTRQLSAMVKLHMPLDESLRVLASTCPNGKLRRVLISTGYDVEKGLSLTEAAGTYPSIFPKYWRSLVSVGEKTDQLDKFLHIAADISQSRVKIQNEIIQALIYPLLVMIFLIVIVLLYLFFLLPFYSSIAPNYVNFTHWFSRSEDVPSFFPIYLFHSATVVILASLMAFIIFNGWGKGRRFVDAVLLNLPFWGQVVRKSNAAVFCRSLDLLLNAGVPLPDALEFSAEICPNRSIKDSILLAKEEVIAGGSLGESLDSYPVFSEAFIWAIHGMETQGNLQQGLGHLTRQMEFQTTMSTRVWLEILNPLMLFILAVSVCFFIIPATLVFQVSNWVN